VVHQGGRGMQTNDKITGIGQEFMNVFQAALQQTVSLLKSAY
jgi:hypothetical protein